MSDSELVERYKTKKFGWWRMEKWKSIPPSNRFKKEREDVRLEMYDIKYEKINL